MGNRRDWAKGSPRASNCCVTSFVDGRIIRRVYFHRDLPTPPPLSRRLSQVDLRSATELGGDELIHGDVYEGFVNIGGGEHGGTGVWEGPAWDEAVNEGGAAAAVTAAAAAAAAAAEAEAEAGLEAREEDMGSGRRRYFVSLIDESIYKKGVFQRLRRRHKVRMVLGTAAAAAAATAIYSHVGPRRGALAEVRGFGSGSEEPANRSSFPF